jgi:hypothetical protein
MARDSAYIKQAAFNITAAFEGAGYHAYQNWDDGIVSYGRFQFTLASGSLFTVIEAYLKAGSGSIADTLRGYVQRIHDRDETLRHEENLKRLLIAAAEEPAMQAAQDAVATTKYWDTVQALSIIPRNIQTPLGQALVFDMAINHGPRHDMIGLAEEAIGVPPKSRMPENGGDERDLITQIARIRQDRMHRLADKHGWEGLRQRGDFWVALVTLGDWDLAGGSSGQIEVKPGRVVQVLFPQERAAAPASPGPAIAAEDAAPLAVGPIAPPDGLSMAQVTYPPDIGMSAGELEIDAPEPAPVAPPTRSEPERIKAAAFNITAAFEGRGYHAYQNFDDGIVSYGRFQFTLASGSLFTVIEAYLKTATGDTADALRGYRQRIHDRDDTLRHDELLKRLLIAAAEDPTMQAAQDAVATTKYWDLVQDLSIQPRNIQTPLGQALVFDMAINHGPRHDMIGLAEEAIGVPPKSRMPGNGGDERDLITQIARIRQDRMHKLADKHGWEGLRQRGDFWVALVTLGDWELAGGSSGQIEVKPGRVVQVRQP